MQIIKLGGSLARTDRLSACLDVVEQMSAAAVMVVPGGGVFADQVRLAQQQWRFDDVTAHAMAILAMQQMALLLQALQPTWRLYSDLLVMQKLTHGIGIWYPDVRLLNAYAVPASWAVTSDSLAAWLASQLQARELIVVKAAVVNPQAALEQLVQQGIVDAAFLQFTAQAEYKITVINQRDFLTKST